MALTDLTEQGLAQRLKTLGLVGMSRCGYGVPSTALSRCFVEERVLPRGVDGHPEGA